MSIFIGWIRLGVDKIAKYANSLGLGKKTGIELEHEKSGIIPTTAWKQQRYKEKWQDGETLSVAIGQGYVLTPPLQLCRMTAAVVNGGILYRPQMVQKHHGSGRQNPENLCPDQ